MRRYTYTSYKLMFPTVKNPGAANSMQVADIRFYESTNGTGAQILSASDSARAVHLASGNAADGLSPWSQLVSGLFSVELAADPSSLRITELHYHPADPTAAELLLVPGSDEDNYEFVELQNVSDQTISLNGVQFTQGITFDFDSGNITSLAPGATVLVVENEAAFFARYGGGFPIAGAYAGKISDGGEQVVLRDGGGQVIHDFVYDDVAPWPVSADGNGPSLEVVDVLGDAADPGNWRASPDLGGSPGTYGNLPGDFDQDGGVDGSDFLAWQRGVGAQYNFSDLASWDANYGEPTALSALAAASFAESFGNVMGQESPAPIAAAPVGAVAAREAEAADNNGLVSATSWLAAANFASTPVNTQLPTGQRAAWLDFVFGRQRIGNRVEASVVETASEQTAEEVPVAARVPFDSIEIAPKELEPIERRDDARLDAQIWEKVFGTQTASSSLRRYIHGISMGSISMGSYPWGQAVISD